MKDEWPDQNEYKLTPTCDNCVQTKCRIKRGWDKHLFDKHTYFDRELIILEVELHQFLAKFCGAYEVWQRHDETKDL